MQQYTLFQASAGKQTFNIPAFGGRLDVSWDPDSQVTQWGGLASFVSYLKTSGLFDRLTHRHRCQLVEHLLRLTSTHLKARDIESSLMRIGEFMKRISAICDNSRGIRQVVGRKSHERITPRATGTHRLNESQPENEKPLLK